MGRGNNSFKPGEETGALIRGLKAEDAFQKLLGDTARKSGAFADRAEHWDFNVKFDVKKIRSVDEWGEANFVWVELMNINGNEGWLYGKADYIAFETTKYWVIVETEKLREFIKRVVTNTELLFDRKEPYRLYRRKGRLDKVVMVPILDICYLGFIAEK
jgi:hypothetical protein